MKSSRRRYLDFIQDYQNHRLDEKAEETPPVRGWLGIGRRREYLRDYLRWLRPHRGQLGVVFVLAVAEAALEMVSPLFTRFIVDGVLLVPGLQAAERITRLHLLGAIFLVVTITAHLIGAARDYRQRLLNAKVTHTLRRALFDRLLHLPLPKLWEMKTGGILSRLSGDVETTTGLLQMAVVSPAIALLRLGLAVGLLMWLNWRLALAALAIIPGILLLSFVFMNRVRPIYRSIRKDAERIDGRVGETFSGIRVVRAFGREKLEDLEYAVGRHTVLRKEMFAHRREMVLWTTWGLILGIVSVVIVWFGGGLYLSGGATLGDIMAFQWYVFLLLNPLWTIVNSFSELQRSLAAMERVFEVLGMADDKPDLPHAVPAPAEVEEIRFEGVEFEYREGQPVVRDFEVTVPGGSAVALVGRSGAGKTTVTDLVARFHDPTRGRILLNGVDIRELRLGSYRDMLAIVQQDVFLFDGSVRDNIAYGRRDATDEEILDAARRANAHEFIEQLPQGYDTFIGERGVKLSGGQQQRLAIARAIVAAPQILILDEATSNLDTESEQLIQASIASLLAGRTTFMIAHRLSTIRRADLILVMEGGRIVERGTHAELMETGGAYHAMVMRQMETSKVDDAADGFTDVVLA